MQSRRAPASHAWIWAIAGATGYLGTAEIRTPAFRRSTRVRGDSAGPGGDLSAGGVGSGACFHAAAITRFGVTRVGASIGGA